MEQKYKSYLWTGSGSYEIILSFFEDNITHLVYTSGWMGRDKQKYLFRCKNEALSQAHGVLRVQALEVENNSGDVTNFEFDEHVDEGTDERPNKVIFFEYFKLPQREEYIIHDNVLAEMRAMGYAGWNEKFDMFLLSLFTLGLSEQSEIGGVVRSLDKTKLDSSGESVLESAEDETPW
jgi:hypothetical protein